MLGRSRLGCIMDRKKPLYSASLLVLLASAFQACGDDEATPADGAGSGGTGDGVRDAGTPQGEPDASVPDPGLDAGADGGNVEADADSVTFVTRQLCVLSGDTLTKVSFPTFEVSESFRLEPIRKLGRVLAVDSAHGEVFLQRPDGLEVFSAEASWLDAPLRPPIVLPAEAAAVPPGILVDVLAVAVDAVNDTLIVLTTDAEELHLSTYPRGSSGLTLPIRRMDFERGSLSDSAGLHMVLDSERERIILATPSRLRTFSLMATGDATPLEEVEMDVRGLVISPSRDEIHLAVPGQVVTLGLDAALNSPPLRSIASDGVGFADDAHGELWMSDGVYDVEATGSATPLFIPTGTIGGLVGMLDGGDEWLRQTDTNMLFTYARQTAPASALTPLRVLDSTSSSGNLDIVGVHRERGEIFVRDARSGFISAYPLTATGVAPALRRFYRPGDLMSAYVPEAAYDEARGLIFVPQLGYDYALSVYSDNLDGFTQPGQQIATQLHTLTIATAHSELLSMKRDGTSFEARSTAPSDLGTLRRSYNMTSPRPSSEFGRSMRLIDMVYDTRRDQVIVAVHDCIPGVPELSEDDDCHFDLKLFPRTVAPDGPVETVELGFAITSLEIDDQNDLLLVQGEDSTTRFYALSAGGGGEPGVRNDGYLSWNSGFGARAVYCD